MSQRKEELIKRTRASSGFMDGASAASRTCLGPEAGTTQQLVPTLSPCPQPAWVSPFLSTPQTGRCSTSTQKPRLYRVPESTHPPQPVEPGHDLCGTHELPESGPMGSLLSHEENRNTGTIARLWDSPEVTPLILETEESEPVSVRSAVCCVSGFRWHVPLPKTTAHPPCLLPVLCSRLARAHL